MASPALVVICILVGIGGLYFSISVAQQQAAANQQQTDCYTIGNLGEQANPGSLQPNCTLSYFAGYGPYVGPALVVVSLGLLAYLALKNQSPRQSPPRN